MTPELPEPIKTCKRIIDNYQCEKYKDYLIDAMTAQAIYKVYMGISTTRKKKLVSMPLLSIVNICWKLVKVA